MHEPMNEGMNVNVRNEHGDDGTEDRTCSCKEQGT